MYVLVCVLRLYAHTCVCVHTHVHARTCTHACIHTVNTINNKKLIWIQWLQTTKTMVTKGGVLNTFYTLFLVSTVYAVHLVEILIWWFGKFYLIAKLKSPPISVRIVVSMIKKSTRNQASTKVKPGVQHCISCLSLLSKPCMSSRNRHHLGEF